MAQSVDQYLEALSSEELTRLAERLTSLSLHPGWEDLTLLVDLWRAKVLRGMEEMPLSGKAASHVGGQLKGARVQEALIAKVVTANKTVQDILEG